MKNKQQTILIYLEGSESVLINTKQNLPELVKVIAGLEFAFDNEVKANSLNEIAQASLTPKAIVALLQSMDFKNPIYVLDKKRHLNGVHQDQKRKEDKQIKLIDLEHVKANFAKHTTKCIAKMCNVWSSSKTEQVFITYLRQRMMRNE